MDRVLLIGLHTLGSLCPKNRRRKILTGRGLRPDTLSRKGLS
jgi:hypothetical protein